jgi:hypothetical protein
MNENNLGLMSESQAFYEKPEDTVEARSSKILN